MPLPLEEVFKISGVPEVTFVLPSAFATLKVALRTPGRGVVLEGPSGIGKSTAVSRALASLGVEGSATRLSARVPVDRDYIARLHDLQPFGLVIVDDFHRLPEAEQDSLADLLKVLADTEDDQSKLVLIGINEAGRSLVSFAPDLANRIDVVKLEVEPDTKIIELVRLGEEALNIHLPSSDRVVEAAQGSFYIAQLLCHSLCTAAGLTEADQGHEARVVDPSFSSVRRSVMDRQEVRFGESVRRFARGTKFRPGGRAPYLHILRWLANSDTWSISLIDEMASNPSEKQSVGQVVQKGFLERLVEEPGVRDLLNYSPSTKMLSVEDPHLVFFLRNLDWSDFIATVGFTDIEFQTAYDVALSFAGEDRQIAEHLRDALEDLGHVVFYDLDEQSRLLAEDLGEFLKPVYEVDARLVVAILGERYGSKRWTQFEADAYLPRVDRGEVIPIVSTGLQLGATDRLRDIGRLNFDPSGDLSAQAASLAAAVSAKVQAAA